MVVSIQLLLLMLYLHQKRRKLRARVPNASRTRSISYDYAKRRFEKKETTKGGTTTHHRYLYRGYLQIAAVNLKKDAPTPDQWFLIWDPTQPIATRPLALRKDGVWYTSGWFPVNKVIMKIISILLFVLSSAGGLLGAQEEQPQIKASYPVMQAALKMPESTVYVRSLDEALRKSENIALCQLYCVRIEKPHNTEGQVTCFLKVLTPLRGKRLAVGSKGKYYSYWEDMLFVPEVKEDPQEDYDGAFHCNIKCFLMCSDDEVGVSESGDSFSIFRESPLIHLIYGKEVEEYITDFLQKADKSEGESP